MIIGRVALLGIILISYTYCEGQAIDQKQKDEWKREISQQLFPSAKLPTSFIFSFPNKFSEKTILATDGKKLDALLFMARHSKGVIFYLHGSIGALDKWGKIAKTYISFHYDFFILDYRGYGKSEGEIKNESQLSSDLQEVYNFLKQTYREGKIILMGQSIGSGLATMLAARILQKNSFYRHHILVLLIGSIMRLQQWILLICPLNSKPINIYKKCNQRS